MLRTRYGVASAAELAGVLDRTPMAVQQRFTRLKLTERPARRGGAYVAPRRGHVHVFKVTARVKRRVLLRCACRATAWRYDEETTAVRGLTEDRA